MKAIIERIRHRAAGGRNGSTGWRTSVSRITTGKDPRVLVRVVLGLLLLANIAVALLVFRPWGGSQEELEREITALRRQVVERQHNLDRLRVVVANVEKGREAGDQFMSSSFLNARTAYSTILAELYESAKRAGVQAREHSYGVEPIEGSHSLGMMTVTGNYEGSYSDLLQFVNQLDRSPRFLILDSLQAAPSQTSQTLLVNVKFNAFVREEEPLPWPQ
jgi:Tfp pilus assembly protein PilO